MAAQRAKIGGVRDDPTWRYPHLDHRIPRPVHVVGCGMKHDLSRQHRNQRERRSRKQEDYVTTGILRGMGAGEIEDWQDDLEGWRDEMGEADGS